MTTEEMEEIEQHIKERFDNDYVKIEDCNDIQVVNTKAHADFDKRISLVAYDMETIKKLLWVIATATIGQLIAMIFSRMMGA